MSVPLKSSDFCGHCGVPLHTFFVCVHCHLSKMAGKFAQIRQTTCWYQRYKYVLYSFIITSVNCRGAYMSHDPLKWYKEIQDMPVCNHVSTRRGKSLVVMCLCVLCRTVGVYNLKSFDLSLTLDLFDVSKHRWLNSKKRFNFHVQSFLTSI
jgi:hypothetical protein